MQDKMDIQYLKRQQVNDQAWDRCIKNATNGLIYGYSFYLDHLTDNWDSLVLNDYESVMPLPWRKKYGVYYLYQPALTAQLGVFGNTVTPDVFRLFLDNIPKKFQYWDMALNHQNLFSSALYPLYERVNYVLRLKQPYEALVKCYRENVRRNIKKAVQYRCTIKAGIGVEEVLAITRQQPQGLTDADFEHFTRLFHHLQKTEAAIAYGVFSEKEELLASCVFFFSHGRAYYILVGNHPNGRTLGASHALIDGFIKDHAGEELLLDFEGSDIRNLAFFYSSFGARVERYAALRLNRMPWYIRWLKHK